MKVLSLLFFIVIQKKQSKLDIRGKLTHASKDGKVLGVLVLHPPLRFHSINYSIIERSF